MKLIIGLGNPGEKYAQTRHNIGFIILDEIAKYFNVSINNFKFKGYYVKFKYLGEDIILLKPQTYMNLSGESIREIVDYFKVNTDDILIIYDDLDLDVGKIRIRKQGSSGGHNGLKSMEQHLKTTNISRIRFGIGKNSQIPTIKYVLGKFSEDELKIVIPQVLQCVNVVDDYLKNGIDYVMNNYN